MTEGVIEHSSDSESEDDVPVARGGKFENLALNDTLQLRHQQLAQSQMLPSNKSRSQSHDSKDAATLPPDAIIYEPPAPKSVKRPKRVSPPMQSHYPSTSLGHSNLAGGDMGSVAVKASLKASALEKERQQAQMHREAAMQAQIQAQRERDAQLQKEKEAQREAQLQAQREAQLQAQREGQRKMAPVGKARRGQTSQQQQQMAAHVQAQQAQVQSQMQMQMQGQQGRLTRSTGKRRADDGPANGTAGAEEKARPRSRGRGEDEGQDVYGTGPSRPHHQSNQSHPPRQQQQQQMYVEKWQQDQYGVNGNYSNTPYGQSVVSSPSDAQPNGRNTPGGLVRSSTMPTGGSIESGMGLSVSEVSGDIGRPSNKDKGQNMWRDKEGRLFVVSAIFSTDPPLLTRLTWCVSLLQMINRHEYQMLEMIGKGGSSKVYRVVSQRNYQQYALKKVAINMVDDEAMRSYATEIQMLKVR